MPNPAFGNYRGRGRSNTAPYKSYQGYNNSGGGYNNNSGYNNSGGGFKSGYNNFRGGWRGRGRGAFGGKSGPYSRAHYRENQLQEHGLKKQDVLWQKFQTNPSDMNPYDWQA